MKPTTPCEKCGGNQWWMNASMEAWAQYLAGGA